MSFPTIPTAAAGRILSVANTAGGVTNTFPDLSGLTKNSGDLLIAIIVSYYAATGSADNAYDNWGGGFTEFFDRADSTSVVAIAGAYKWSTGSETGTFTVDANTAATLPDRQMILLSIPGAHPSTPPEAGTRQSNTTIVADVPAFNPTGWDVEDTLWIAVGGSGEISTGGTYTGMGASAPTNYTGLFVTGISEDIAGGVDAAVAFRQLAAASDDPGGFPDVDTSNARNSSLLIAVRPAPSATPVDSDNLALTGDAHMEGIGGSAISVQIFSAVPLVADGQVDGLVATAVGVINILDGEASGAIGWAGTVTGTAAHNGATSGTVGWVGSATGQATHTGAASGTVGWAGSATGVTDPRGAASGSIIWAGTADGEAPLSAQQGTATGSITWAGTATGVTKRSGDATGSLLWAGTADGATTQQGSATGALDWAGSADGSIIYEGSSSGAIGWSGTVQGEAPAVGVNDGNANGNIAWAGTATGVAGCQGTAAGTILWTGIVDGITSRAGAAVGTVDWLGLAMGDNQPEPPRRRLEAHGLGFGWEGSSTSTGLEGSSVGTGLEGSPI